MKTTATTSATPTPRLTSQRLMSADSGRCELSADRRGYEPYPEFALPQDTVGSGFAELARTLRGARTIAIDGDPSVDWSVWIARFCEAWQAQSGHRPERVDARHGMRDHTALRELLTPYLGGNDPLFGTRCPLELEALFNRVDAAEATEPRDQTATSIVYGPGAGLFAPQEAVLVYVDVPKNEMQYRARAGAEVNLFAAGVSGASDKYKRAYFVDWPVLKRHKAKLMPRLDWYVDDQFEAPTFITGSAFREALTRLAHQPFRPRPWFEPGPWGGQRLMTFAEPTCEPDTPNLAWSFEFIAPENGVVLADDHWRCEVSVDWLMLGQGQAVQGFGYDFFGDEFPIRFDFLDTIEGGNLSVQCHPQPAYIREAFGERFTQDETYYILDCTDEATVYLGFQEAVDPAAFEAALRLSESRAEELDVEAYVQRLDAVRGDLFLIPHGTVHCSGRGSLVLEISATPYIFTFKMYDWLRPGLDGKMRPLNIERAMANLDFTRRGERVQRELVSQPRVVAHGEGWRHESLPTHADHFYQVDRYHLDAAGVEIQTHDSPQVAMVVAGGPVSVSTATGSTQEFGMIETFVVPAATGRYRVEPHDGKPSVLVVASLKPIEQWPGWMREQ